MAGRARQWALVVLALAVTMVAAGCNWQQFGNDAGNSHSSGDPFIGLGNVGDLSVSWFGTTQATITGGIAVVDGLAYVGANDGNVYVFDATAAGCTGTPKSCAPLWTASVGGVRVSAPAVVDGVLYAKNYAGTLAAFDATGSTGCSGTPKVCSPLWTASLGLNASTPAVANGFIYVATPTGLRVLDAAGATGCSGTPTTCTPVWTGTMPETSSVWSPAVGDGIVAVAGDRLYAFDARGDTGCSGVPAACAPLWAGPKLVAPGAPSISVGRVHIFDAVGLTTFPTAAGPSCTGTPLVCEPTWSAPLPPGRMLAVGNGLVYSVGASIAAYGADGSTGCAGTPRVCSPVWTSDLDVMPGVAPAVVNGVLYVLDKTDRLAAFDAGGVTGCSGTPTTCAPLFQGAVPTITDISPAVSQGTVYVAVARRLEAFTLASYTRPTCGPNPHIGLGPCEIQDAYRLPSAIAGQDQTIAIVDAFDDPKAEADLAVYRAAYGLPPCTSANGCFTKLTQRGTAGPLPPPDAGWSVEISLDLDMVSASCPRCRIVLVEADDNSTGNLLAAVQTALGRAPAAVSNSYGGPETPTDTELNGRFASTRSAVLFATGDGGFGTSYPSSAPNVVAVGGTNLLPAPGTARGWSESAWDGAGSGCSLYQAKPAWQDDGPCERRTIADVSAVAGDPGLAVYDTYGGVPGWITVAGTSASTPIVAGVYGLAPTVGRPDALWSRRSELFDVTGGANGSCAATYLCTAVVGFDGPTGNGTPCGTGAFSLVPGTSASCQSLGAGAGLQANAVPRPRKLPVTPVCPPVTPGRMRCLSLRVTG